MDAKIIKFYPNNAAECPDAVLEQAIGRYDDVLILGYDKEGYLDPRATLGLKKRDIIYLLETFKTKLMNGDYDEL